MTWSQQTLSPSSATSEASLLKEGHPPIAHILPPEVRFVALTVSDAAPEAFLFPEESALIERAVPRRRHEFAQGRSCARQALAALGFPNAPILSGPQRQPLWPSGIVGSVTHCPGFVAAAVARTSSVLALGIDAEPQVALPSDTLDLILSQSERRHVGQLPTGETAWERLIASAKESLFKAWFPLTGRWLDFLDAEITIEPTLGAFTARLRVVGPRLNGQELSCWPGRYIMERGLILTAIVIEANDDAVPTQP